MAAKKRFKSVIFRPYDGMIVFHFLNAVALNSSSNEHMWMFISNKKYVYFDIKYTVWSIVWSFLMADVCFTKAARWHFPELVKRKKGVK